MVVGASAFELRQWANHGHVNFWMPMCEAKDGGRTYLHMARAAMTGKLKGPDRAPLEKRVGKKIGPTTLRRSSLRSPNLCATMRMRAMSPRKSVLHLT